MIISIGALGGSGTRAVAEVFIQSGVFMGDDLNESNDNLIFSRLFKNPEWFRAASLEEKNKRLGVFQAYMQDGALTRDDFMELSRAAFNNATFPSNYSFYIRLLKTLVRRGSHRAVWGWKEPNTQIFLAEIFNFFPRIKYIHVLRNGLDMAFSRNRQQLHNWGWKYGIHVNGGESEKDLAVKQLDYWIRSTQDVLDNASGFDDRFYMLNHSRFCQNPRQEIDRILEFSGINVAKTIAEKLYGIPRNTGSNNRYKNYDLGVFGRERLDFVEAMGFEI